MLGPGDVAVQTADILHQQMKIGCLWIEKFIPGMSLPSLIAFLKDVETMSMWDKRSAETLYVHNPKPVELKTIELEVMLDGEHGEVELAAIELSAVQKGFPSSSSGCSFLELDQLFDTIWVIICCCIFSMFCIHRGGWN